VSIFYPSYFQKLDRAEKHLCDLKLAIAKYADSHPYALTNRGEGESNDYRLHATEPVDPDVALIAGDFIHNVHSALDHLAVLLNPPKMRSHVMFPIFWRGVWEDDVPGENEQRTEDRGKWRTSTREMCSEARELIKRQQPDYVANDGNKTVHFLGGLKRLSNDDKHMQLPVISTGVQTPVITWMNNGLVGVLSDDRTEGMIKNDAPVPIPDGATDVEVKGTPRVVVLVKKPQGKVDIPEFFDHILEMVRDRIAVPLTPFLWKRPDKT